MKSKLDAWMKYWMFSVPHSFSRYLMTKHFHKKLAVESFKKILKRKTVSASNTALVTANLTLTSIRDEFGKSFVVSSAFIIFLLRSSKKNVYMSLRNVRIVSAMESIVLIFSAASLLALVHDRFHFLRERKWNHDGNWIPLFLGNIKCEVDT